MPPSSNPNSPAHLPGFPVGWFVVAFSTEIEPGSVHPRRYFGTDLVLWRDDSGTAHVFDAHCPHLGAHLGHGGTVEGNCIRCPFHGWGFDPSGECVDIPYAKRIPPRARSRAWPTLERNGMILVWHGQDGREPEDYIPTLEQFGADGWSPWVTRQMSIATHPREVVENVADIAHFLPVHGTTVESFEANFDGPRATQTLRYSGLDKKGVERRHKNVATYYGPGLQFSEMEAEFPTVIANAHIPVEHDRLELRMGLLISGLDYETKLGRTLAGMWIDALQEGYLQDVAIWENKLWRDRPALCDGDGPIAALRKWYEQFYSDQG